MSKAGALVAGQMILFALLVGVWLVWPPVSSAAGVVAGLLLIVIGLACVALAVRAHQQANHTPPRVSPEPRPAAGLVQSGLYARIRHPIYTGVLSVAFGLALAHGHPAAFGVALALTGWLTLKSMYEETLLLRQWSAYAAYRQRTGRFLPFL
ncbi:MAG: isoprenylcysteine carboxylmethyltransferase family protein [Anaerolineae bacterium]|jgi:protein-S-isoprenylcysteine O-methyltransferase Ste14|nr:isoprenylcysteine carboxylmethyltransferase family protein [Anaerolineae bacterium]